MNVNNKLVFLLIAPILIALAAEAFLFAYLVSHFGFMAVAFYYALKSVVGMVGAYYLMGKNNPDRSTHITMSSVLTLESRWRRTAIIIALCTSIPGILTSIVAAVLALSPLMRYLFKELWSVLLIKTILKEAVRRDNLNQSKFVEEGASKEQEYEEYHDIYAEDAYDIWQMRKPIVKEKTEKKEDTVIVDINA